MDAADVENLREQVDMALQDPDYSIIANFQINWEEMGADQRLLDLSGEYDLTNSQLYSGLGVTEGLLSGESSYSGDRINLEVINTRYMLLREQIQEMVENHFFKPMCARMGFIEEAGAAQLMRDARIAAIYEGTNGIQAMDLVSRKMMDGGEAAFRLLHEVQAGAEAARPTLPDLAGDVWMAAQSLRETTVWMVAQSLEDRFAGSVPYLRAFARVLGGHLHLRAALADAARLPLARVAIRRLMPEHIGLLAQAREGAAGLFDVSPGGMYPECSHSFSPPLRMTTP
jgi:hypothetical protein